MNSESWIALGAAAVSLVGSGFMVIFGAGRTKEKVDSSAAAIAAVPEMLRTAMVDIGTKITDAQTINQRDIAGMRRELEAHRSESARALNSFREDVKEGFRKGDDARLRVWSNLDVAIKEHGGKIDGLARELGDAKVAIGRLEGERAGERRSRMVSFDHIDRRRLPAPDGGEEH